MVERIVCDRRGDEAKRGDVGFGEMICTAFHAGVRLSFADGSRVMVDLCQPFFCGTGPMAAPACIAKNAAGRNVVEI